MECRFESQHSGAFDDKVDVILGLTKCHLNDIPNKNHLIPIQPHPAHELHDGILLQPQGVVENSAGVQVNICQDCLKELTGGGCLCCTL